jgi:hypothetical protein
MYLSNYSTDKYDKVVSVMVEPVSMIVGGILIAHGPSWLNALQKTLLSKGKEFALEKSKEQWHHYLDQKNLQHHLDLVLQNAAERGISCFHTLPERDLYRDILAFLSDEGAHNKELRDQALTLFSLSGAPDLSKLNELITLHSDEVLQPKILAIQM